jgi:hypothetical protein
VTKQTKKIETTVEEDIVPDHSGEGAVHDAQHQGSAPELELGDATLSEVVAHAERNPDADPLKGNPKKVGGKGFHTSARVAAPSKPAPADSRSESEHNPQQLESSGHDHLDKPSLSEEVVHADKVADPLPDAQKVGGSGTKKGSSQPKK